MSSALAEAGWRLTEEGIKLCDGQAKKVLNLDLRDIGAGCLPEEINRGKADVLEGGFVVQVTQNNAEILICNMLTRNCTMF